MNKQLELLPTGVPFGCAFGIWHYWAPWTDTGKAKIMSSRHVESHGVTQERRCIRCNALQIRSCWYL